MEDRLPIEGVERRVRLAVLLSLGWLLALSPLAFLLPYRFLAEHPRYFAALAITYVAGVGWKLMAASKFFRTKDRITAAFAVLVFYVAGFIVAMFWLWLQPPEKAADWAAAAGLFLISSFLIGAGCLLLLSPRIARKVNKLCDGKVKVRSAPESEPGLQLGARVAGLFLATVGCWVLLIGVRLARESWHR